MHSAFHGAGEDVLGRILMTCEEMIKDRWFSTVERTDDLSQAISSPHPVLRGTSPEGACISVYVVADEKVGIKCARGILDAEAGNDVVVVSLEGTTPFTRKECDGKKIQFLTARDLCVNKTRHHLVPRHVPVDAPPKGISVTSLPRILDTDPIVQYYNFPIGTILRMDRVFGGSEVNPYFRVVVAVTS